MQNKMWLQADLDVRFRILILLLLIHILPSRQASYDYGDFISEPEAVRIFRTEVLPPYARFNADNFLFSPNESPPKSFLYADRTRGYFYFDQQTNKTDRTYTETLNSILSTRQNQYLLPSVYHTCRNLLVMNFEWEVTASHQNNPYANKGNCILIFDKNSHIIRYYGVCSQSYGSLELRDVKIRDVMMEEQNQRYLYIQTSRNLLVLDTTKGGTTTLTTDFGSMRDARITMFNKQVFFLRGIDNGYGGRSLLQATLTDNFTSWESSPKEILNSREIGWIAGPFASASWSAHDLIAINEDVLVLAGAEGSKLWIVEKKIDCVSVMCNGYPDNIEGDRFTCSLGHPIKLVKLDDYLYILSLDGISQMKLLDVSKAKERLVPVNKIGTEQPRQTSNISTLGGLLLVSAIFIVMMLLCLIKNRMKTIQNLNKKQSPIEVRKPSRPLPEIKGNTRSESAPVTGDDDLYDELGDQYYASIYSDDDIYYEICEEDIGPTPLSVEPEGVDEQPPTSLEGLNVWHDYKNIPGSTYFIGDMTVQNLVAGQPRDRPPDGESHAYCDKGFIDFENRHETSDTEYPVYLQPPRTK